jgi:hypothetical protein
MERCVIGRLGGPRGRRTAYRHSLRHDRNLRGGRSVAGGRQSGPQRLLGSLCCEPPNFTPGLDHPPMTPAVPTPGHPLPAPLGPTQFFDPADVPPWLKDPSPPGFTINPVQQPPAFDWDRPDAAPPPPAAHSTPPSSGGQSWLPEIGHDLSEGGKAVFGWVVVGGVLVWALLSGVGQSGGAALP